MKYKIMKMLCMFDLPVDTPREKRAYRTFRTNLIKQGFTMIQYSVYIRTCPSREYAARLENRIKKNGTFKWKCKDFNYYRETI